MKQYFHLILVVGLTALVFSACKNRRAVSDAPRAHGMTLEEILKKNEEARLEFRTMAFKGKADFTTVKDGKENNIGFSYRINIAKDSLIWATISKFGIPAATILIDQDSVRMKVSIDRSAILCDFEVLSNMLGMEVNYRIVESFFTGDPDMRAQGLKLDPTEKEFIHLTEERPPFLVSWFLNAKHFKLDKMLAKDPANARESSVLYSDFKTVNGQKVPGAATIEVTQAEPVRIALLHSSIEFEPEKTNFKLRIPDSYTIRPCKLD